MSRERQGELMMVAFSMLEGWFPIVSMMIAHAIGSLFAYAWTSVLAAFFFFSAMLFKKRLREFACREAYRDLFYTSLFITLMFLLVFLSMRYTTADNIALLMFMQLLFAFLYFDIFGHERMLPMHAWGALSMGTGAMIVLWPHHFTFNRGDLLVLGAAAIAPIANYYQKRARERVSSETILTVRSLFAIPVIFALALANEPLPTIDALSKSASALLINGTLIMGGSKLLWVETLHRLSITKMMAMMAMVPLFTLLFSSLLFDELPSPHQLFGALPILVGGILITRPIKESRI